MKSRLFILPVGVILFVVIVSLIGLRISPYNSDYKYKQYANPPSADNIKQGGFELTWILNEPTLFAQNYLQNSDRSIRELEHYFALPGCQYSQEDSQTVLTEFYGSPYTLDELKKISWPTHDELYTVHWRATSEAVQICGEKRIPVTIDYDYRFNPRSNSGTLEKVYSVETKNS